MFNIVPIYSSLLKNLGSLSMPKKPYYHSDDTLFDIHSYDLDYEANSIYLMGREDIFVDEDGSEPGVEYSMANRFIRNMNTLRRKNKDPILIHMKTCGGFVEEGMAIYDTIMTCPNKITILNYTHARSMSSIIFQAADKRVMMPHSGFLFHEGEVWAGGTQKQFLSTAEEVKKFHLKMLDIYYNSMVKNGVMKGQSKKKILNWLQSQMDKKEDVYLDAEETIHYGFADEIFSDWSSLLEF